MLEPREADIPALFLVFVVLPLVAYILLGRWSEDAKKRERVSLLAQLAAEEAFSAESRTNASSIPLVSSSNNGHHECVRCFNPATTRCSRCKSVRYCSGQCQIMHWRQVHKKECHQLENSGSSTSSSRPMLMEQSVHDMALLDGNMSSQYFRHNIKPTVIERTPLDTNPVMSYVTSAPTDCFEIDASQVCMPNRRTKEKRFLHKPNREMSRSEDGNAFYSSEDTTVDNTLEYQSLHGNTIEPKSNCGSKISPLDDEAVELSLPSKATVVKESSKGKNGLPLPGSKISRPPKSRMVGSGEHLCSEIESRGDAVDGTKTARATSMEIMKMMGLRKPAIPARHDAPEVNGDRHQEIKMLFPYEQFLKLCRCEVFELIPRGLMNCGNSCYANAVLQCLACTKPLIVYLLHRSHSRSCGAKDWCLMCELEQHVMMLRESGGPLSPSRILSHMRSTSFQIGHGSQEDAHEFLRLLIASMQSICLDGLGGESKVDPRLQETTFIQHTFGGRLRSKVKCLRCHHESARYENIMDLTLEIYGWVESLEDALTQFTTPEDLDGENMYRCGRCSGYVRARKQLSIHEAPNVLTIVLKRFQEGRYGKINKCITFPDMLDMIPFMTGSNDMPPLYMLYGVVVHLDTLNASFSGHYVSYVKDLQGNWFRIDDTEVQLVPMSHVMSEGAYILFYMRSCPRPQRAFTSKASKKQAPASSRHCTLKVSRTGQSKHNSEFISPEPSGDKRTVFTMDYSNHAASNGIQFSDATSSDWSIFTSSDEASFTTESARDSFSTVDYADTCNDPVSSIFNNTIYAAPDYSRFDSEEKGYISNSYLTNHYLDIVHRGDDLKQVSDFSVELPSDSNYDMFVRYGSNPKLSVDRTCSRYCKL